MFTQDQGQELIDNTTSTWTTINGVNGRKFISKTDSSKYIFLPAGGWWDQTILTSAETVGEYWNATLPAPSSDYTSLLYLTSSSSGLYFTYPRLRGFSIRQIK